MPYHEANGDGGWEPDPLILDDQALVVHVPVKGLVVLTGCGHAGAINIARHAHAAHRRRPPARPARGLPPGRAGIRTDDRADGRRAAGSWGRGSSCPRTAPDGGPSRGSAPPCPRRSCRTPSARRSRSPRRSVGHVSDTDAAQIHRLFEEAFNAADIEGLVALYEPTRH